jgi:hypothetical protein
MGPATPILMVRGPRLQEERQMAHIRTKTSDNDFLIFVLLHNI